MVRLLTTLLLLHLPLTAFSSPDLKLLIEQNKQQLGYAFNATLIANDISENLSGIDLSSLRKDFGVIVNEYSGDQDNIKTRSQQQLSLELYPRRTGLIQVPELLFASSSSNPIDVEVLPAITASGPINIKYNVSTLQPWQRQQVLLTVNVTTPDKFSRLETKTPQDAGSEYRNIPATKKTLSNITHLNTGWAIYSLSSGNHEFSPPPLLYYIQGVVERRFYLPTIQLDVKPLPGYIPPLMPVGRVFIESRIDENNPLNTDTTYNWVIRLHSPELLNHHLPPILRQITSDDNITFQPAQSVRRENITFNSSHAEVTHTLPFKLSTSGNTTLPTLRVQYFDAVLGRVVVINHALLPKWALAIYWQLLIGVTLLSILFYLIKCAWKYWLCLNRRHKHMQYAINSIRTALDGKELRDAMHNISKAEGWPTNLSLQKWAYRWENTFSTPIANTVTEFSNIYYAKTSKDIARVKHDLLAQITNRKYRNAMSRFISDCARVC